MRIAPQERLVWMTLIAGVPFCVMLGLGGVYRMMGAAGIGVVLFVALADLLGSKGRIEGISLLLPGRVNLFKGREGVIELQIVNEHSEERVMRVGLNLPPGLFAEKEDLWVKAPAGAKAAMAGFPCTPLERGSFRIPSVHLEVVSALGFWALRKTERTNVEARVYPDLLTERKRVGLDLLQRRGVGLRAQRHVGKGRDFEKIRDYAHGDPIQDVHWKATAKFGRPVTKVFQIERTQEVYVAVDCSRLSGRPSPALEGEEKELPIQVTSLDRFLNAALLIGLAAEQQGDHFGLITFSDKVHQVIRARNGHSHFALCRDALFELQPRMVTPDFDEFAATIRVRLRKRALVILLSALDDPLIAENCVRSLELIRRQHLVLVNMIEPAGARSLFSRHEGEVVNSREVYESLAGHLVWQKLREIQKTLEMRGVKFAVSPTELLTREVVGQYLEVKRRQIL